MNRRFGMRTVFVVILNSNRNSVDSLRLKKPGSQSVALAC